MKSKFNIVIISLFSIATIIAGSNGGTIKEKLALEAQMVELNTSISLSNTQSKYDKKEYYIDYDQSDYPDRTLPPGDTFDDAIVIDALPYNGTGSTAGYANDYDESCPYTGSTSPDVVYSFTPDIDMTIDADLCDSGYDTKLYIYENDSSVLSACNDDSCPGYKSELFDVALTAGNTYYIIVDGYNGASGDYEINVSAGAGPCVDDLVASGDPEIEPNGGLNADPVEYDPRDVGTESEPTLITGTYFTFVLDGTNNRDTDWFNFSLTETSEIHASVDVTCGDVIIGIVDNSGSGAFLSSSNNGGGGEDESLTFALDAGDYWLFIASAVYEGLPDETTYNASFWASDSDVIFGCTDSSAPEYNPDATDDDGSCWADCGGSVGFIGDGDCDSSNNNEGCGYDGGDCCPGDCVTPCEDPANTASCYDCTTYGGTCDDCINPDSADNAPGGQCDSTMVDPPDAPVSLACESNWSADNGSEIDLSWDAATGADEYEVFYDFETCEEQGLVTCADGSCVTTEDECPDLTCSDIGGVESYISDGDCDIVNNNEACGWDGGDCCGSTCTSADYTCSDACSQECLDPAANDDCCADESCDFHGDDPACADTDCGHYLLHDGWTCEEIETNSNGLYDCSICEAEGLCDIAECEDGYCPEGTYWDGNSCYSCTYCLNSNDDSECSAESGNDCCGACGGSFDDLCDDGGTDGCDPDDCYELGEMMGSLACAVDADCDWVTCSNNTSISFCSPEFDSCLVDDVCFGRTAGDDDGHDNKIATDRGILKKMYYEGVYYMNVLYNLGLLESNNSREWLSLGTTTDTTMTVVVSDDSIWSFGVTANNIGGASAMTVIGDCQGGSAVIGDLTSPYNVDAEGACEDYDNDGISDHAVQWTWNDDNYEEAICDDGSDALIDCVGTEFCNDDPLFTGYDCIVGCENGWLGDSYCDDGSYGLDFQCDEYGWDCGDCNDVVVDPNGYCDDARDSMDANRRSVFNMINPPMIVNVDGTVILNPVSSSRSISYEVQAYCDDCLDGAAWENTYNATSKEFLIYGVDEGAEICAEVRAVSSNTNTVSEWSETACGNAGCAPSCILGDASGDGSVDVLDLVVIANYILAQDTDPANHPCADYDGDGYITILDLVSIVSYIMGGSGRDIDATFATLKIDGGSLSMAFNGGVDGIQMTLSHGTDFAIELTDQALLADYKTTANQTILIVLRPEGEEIFTFSGDFEVVEVIAANSSGLIDVKIAPAKFALSLAYPNPFNPITSMTLDVIQAGGVSVLVYNIMGQVVATLASGHMDANTYTLSWDASNISSGVYFVKAETAGSVQMQKIVLMK